VVLGAHSHIDEFLATVKEKHPFAFTPPPKRFRVVGCLHCALTKMELSKDKKVQAKGFVLVGDATNAKAMVSEESSVDEVRRDAATAFEKAHELFKELKMKVEEASALQSAIRAIFATCDGASAAKALALATDLQSLGGEYVAVGAEAAAVAHMQEFSRSGTFLSGGREAMLAAAMQALSLSDDAERKASAQKILAEARRTGRGAL